MDLREGDYIERAWSVVQRPDSLLLCLVRRNGIWGLIGEARRFGQIGCLRIARPVKVSRTASLGVLNLKARREVRNVLKALRAEPGLVSEFPVQGDRRAAALRLETAGWRLTVEDDAGEAGEKKGEV